MKKVPCLLFVLLLILFCSCGQNSTKNSDLVIQQQNFSNFLLNKSKEVDALKNDIQEKEYLEQYQKDLFNYVDTTHLFINWKGTISDIETDESGTTITLKFRIKYPISDHNEVTFYCNHLVSKKSISDDYIYNIVKNLSNEQIVYFDGFIRMKDIGLVYYEGDHTADSKLSISQPGYGFLLTDIATAPKLDFPSDNMKKALSIIYKINKAQNDQYLGLISEQESDEEFNKLSPSINELRNTLTDSEKNYIERLAKCWLYNRLYSNVVIPKNLR